MLGVRIQIMRTMLLSFKADVYKRVLSGEKIYEHRKVFPNEPILAYLYVSSPAQVITGKMVLGNKRKIEDFLDIYHNDLEVCKRVHRYMKEHNYVMEIQDFQQTTEIPLSTLRKDLDRFIIPQMYYFLDDTPLLKYIENNIKNEGVHIINDFMNVDKKFVCNS